MRVADIREWPKTGSGPSAIDFTISHRQFLPAEMGGLAAPTIDIEVAKRLAAFTVR